MRSAIELKQLELKPSLGTYGPDDFVPEAHLLDLTLTIDPRLVLIPKDGMDLVFDYDPLIAKIDQLAKDGHYLTQEWLISRIVDACAMHQEITAVDICLSKRPVMRSTGVLGVRLTVDQEDLDRMRSTNSKSAGSEEE
jgi:dihydroneopterin aldolase